MRRQSTSWRLPSLLVAVALIAGGAIVLGAGGGSDPGGGGSPAGTPRVPGAIQVLSVRHGRRIQAGFLGLSIEFQAIRSYTGNDAGHVNPVLVQLIKNLSPGQAPALRIGGDSTDMAWVPIRGVHPPAVVSYGLTPSWLATTAALARTLGARMTLGINLAANRRALAAAEARAYVSSFGRSAIAALEIGNEPNVYGKIALFPTHSGHVKARSSRYDYPTFVRQFRRLAAALPAGLSLMGPALAAGPIPDSGSWIDSMPGFLKRDRRVVALTVHRYPLRNCFVPPSNPQYPTISHLLASYATTGLVDSLKRWVAIAHAHRRALRVDELNSVACRGKTGVSDTFTSSLWMLNALFGLVRLGVDGVNVHTLPRSAYELFRFSRSDGRWRAFVTPVYYGMQMFAQATPPGSRLLPVSWGRGHAGVSIWATGAPDGRIRMVVINESRTRSQNVELQPPSSSLAAATVERLRAPAVTARQGVTLGGQTYGSQTETGLLGPLHATSLRARANGTYWVAVPRASAAMVTFAP